MCRQNQGHLWRFSHRSAYSRDEENGYKFSRAWGCCTLHYTDHAPVLKTVQWVKFNDTFERRTQKLPQSRACTFCDSAPPKFNCSWICWTCTENTRIWNGPRTTIPLEEIWIAHALIHSVLRRLIWPVDSKKNKKYRLDLPIWKIHSVYIFCWWLGTSKVCALDIQTQPHQPSMGTGSKS